MEKRKDIVEKREVVNDMQYHFNKALFDARGYIAFNNIELKESTLREKEIIKELIDQFNQLEKTDTDEAFSAIVTNFYQYYFEDTLPQGFLDFEDGDIVRVNETANNGATAAVNTFQEELESYLESITQSLNEEVSSLTNKIAILELVFLLYMLIILSVVFVIGRMMVNRIGKPLADFAFAAEEIASGNDADIQVDKSREDELSILSLAFHRMAHSIQEKEQDLLAQNEELIAQQDELHAQQYELEKIIETVQNNEETLKRRNQLINGLSSTLDKQEVLDSIIVNICKVLKADRGIISMVEEESYSVYAVSESGAKQFRDHLHNGMYKRLEQDRMPFIVKREQIPAEKGYHIETGYVYDLYLPVFSASNHIVAVMMLSRLSDRFIDFDMEEFSSLAKQIGISLDKISLFEQTEQDRLVNQEILNNVQEGIQLVSKNGEIIQVNTKFCELMGDDAQSHFYVGQGWSEWSDRLNVLTDEADDIISFIQDAMNNIKEHHYTFKLKDHKVIRIYAEALYRGKEKFGTVFVYRDITKDYEVDKMKSEFVSTVSHELRTPLASILGFTELMIHRNLKPEKQKKYLTTIYGEAKRLTALINDFLDVQRMEAGKQTYEKKYMELLPIIEKVVDNQHFDSSVHPIKITSSIQNSYILGDKSKIEQAFTNIISNAIKYSPAGGNIDIRLWKQENELHVSIADEGLGIPDSSLNKLFKKFYRVDNSDRRKIGGTGLGLSIVQEIMTAHEGEIKVESDYGKGSTFILVFPIIDIETDPFSAEADQDMENKSEKAKYKIMVVEDDHSLAELIVHELKDNGFQVDYYRNGKEAIKGIKQSIPDAIVLDIMFEDDSMDGWEWMKTIKLSDDYRKIPIVISSALDEKEKGIELGAMDYLIKPYPPSQLSKTIMQTLLKLGKVGQVLIPEKEKEQ